VNILALSLTRMGDMVQSTPLFSGLREKHPDARITLLVSSDFQDFARRVPGIDRLLVLDIRQFMDRTPPPSWIDLYHYLESFLNEVKAEGFDQVINLSHSRLSALMVHYLGIDEVRGFACNPEGERVTHHPWMQYFGIEPFNRRLNPFNLVEIYMQSGDIPPAGKAVKLQPPAPGTPGDPAEAMPGEAELLIGLQAGSSLKGRRWPASRFAELADLLAERLGARVVLFGVASEAPLAASIMEAMRHRERAIDLTGKTSIDQLMRWLTRVRLLVSNDTGTLHIAAALGKPVVGLYFAHAHPHETGPYAPGNLVFQARIPCAPCSYAVDCENVVCVDKVQPRHVFEAIESRLREHRWRLSQDESLAEVDVYETREGPSGSVRLVPLIRRAPGIEDVLRLAYEVLWPRALKAIAGEVEAPAGPLLKLLKGDHGDANLKPLAPGLARILDELARLAALAASGVDVAQAVAAWRPGKGDGIEVLGQQLADIDERIVHAGCVSPEIKPLADLYVKRKENHQGEDIQQLAQANGEDYRRLNAEALALSALIGELLQEETGASASGCFSPVSMST